MINLLERFASIHYHNMLELLLILLCLFIYVVARLGIKKFESAIGSDQFLIDRAVFTVFFKAGHKCNG